MAWVCVDKQNNEVISESEFYWDSDLHDWFTESYDMILPKGSIKKLIGRELQFEDEPVKLES
jgi:hypothetical protein